MISNLRVVAPPAPANVNAHVRAEGVSMRYQLGGNDIWALTDANLDLERGEFIALCGSSGSGKTTLLNLFGCLDLPTTGEIHIAGRNVSKMTDNELATFRSEQLGFVFQTFNLLPVLSAIENVEYPLMKKNMSSRQRREQAMHALELVGLAKHAHHRPDQLSGGQRQRVAIARAIVHQPELIIADEPTANLDKKTAGEILDLISTLNKSMGVTVIIATHDPLVLTRTSRTVHITDGRISR